VRAKLKRLGLDDGLGRKQCLSSYDLVLPWDLPSVRVS
jgi:hypothetical protein